MVSPPLQSSGADPITSTKSQRVVPSVVVVVVVVVVTAVVVVDVVVVVAAVVLLSLAMKFYHHLERPPLLSFNSLQLPLFGRC